MGSFSEVVLSFEFRADVPDEVLAAFSDLEQPIEENAYWGPAPVLPEPVREPVEHWCPDWREAGITDEFEAEPWRHDWARWLRASMDLATIPSAALVWLPGRWKLTCRFSWKSWADAIFVTLNWLGPFIASWDEEHPRFVGYIDDEADPRPYLLWAHSGRLVMEDLIVGGADVTG